MANQHRGEIEAVFNDEPYTLCLTLGALAELESTLGVNDILALGQRFQNGVLSAQDILALLKAGLRGGGHMLNDTQVANLQHENGLYGAIHTVVALLKITFGETANP